LRNWWYFRAAPEDGQRQTAATGTYASVGIAVSIFADKVLAYIAIVLLEEEVSRYLSAAEHTACWNCHTSHVKFQRSLLQFTALGVTDRETLKMAAIAFLPCP
jgi:hypothetical protein